MRGAELALFFSPLLVAGDEKGLGDEVGEHAQFVVRQWLKFNVRSVVMRGAVGFAVGG